MNDALRIEDLCVSLGTQEVLKDVSLHVRRGELVGLIGPNGAGKTTLMRTVMGLVRRTCGEIAAERQIGYVPQIQNLDWSYPMSAEQLVMTSFLARRGGKADVLAGRKEKWAAVYRALRRVGLAKLRRRTIAQLSGGQKQRVLIARALAPNPALLLLDEPFTGLDHPNQDLLSDLFGELAQNGVGILMSTHDLTQAIDICDRLVMLNETVRAAGKPQELLIPKLWTETYRVREDSALLRALGMGTK